MALCLNCGEVKFGAICPCPKCNVASTGNIGLDIAFSDHHLSVPTLEAFGKVVRAIRGATQDDQLRFWSFLHYISANHSDILRIEQPPEQQAQCDAVLALAQPPPVTVERPPMRFRLPGDGNGRRWWQFWK